MCVGLFVFHADNGAMRRVKASVGIYMYRYDSRGRGAVSKRKGLKGEV